MTQAHAMPKLPAGACHHSDTGACMVTAGHPRGGGGGGMPHAHAMPKIPAGACHNSNTGACTSPCSSCRASIVAGLRAAWASLPKCGVICCISILNTWPARAACMSTRLPAHSRVQVLFIHLLKQHKPWLVKWNGQRAVLIYSDKPANMVCDWTMCMWSAAPLMYHHSVHI